MSSNVMAMFSSRVLFSGLTFRSLIHLNLLYMVLGSVLISFFYM